MRFCKLLPTATAIVALGCTAGESAEYPEAVSADPDHYSVEFENDAARLLRISYGTGETSVMHTHPENCGIALSDGSWEMTLPDGSVIEETASFGDVDCYEAGAHNPRNQTTEPAELILVELKEGGAPGTDWSPEEPHAVTADPAHYTIEFENDVLRIVRVRYQGGETSVMHHHPANCVIYLSDQTVTFELPSGEVIEAPQSEVGAVNCVDGDVHLPTNTADEELEVVLVEFKGRAARGG